VKPELSAVVDADINVVQDVCIQVRHRDIERCSIGEGKGEDLGEGIESWRRGHGGIDRRHLVIWRRAFSEVCQTYFVRLLLMLLLAEDHFSPSVGCNPFK
jgi:hypothetical protein